MLSLDDVYIDFDAKPCMGPISDTVDKVLKNSIRQPGFETLERVPGCMASVKQQRQDIKKEQSRSKGPNWYNMKTPSMTTELQNDLKVLRMRSVLDPKHFYKKNDIKGLPKHFQVGKYVDSPADFYSSRLTKKQRKKTIVEELMADAQFMKYNKKKYKEQVQKKKRLHAKAHQHSKRLKKGKKR